MRRYTTIILLAVIGAAVYAQVPTTEPSSDYAITPMRLQTLKGAPNYLYSEGETTLDAVKQTVDTNFNPLRDLFESGKLQATGPAIFVFTGISMDMSKPFKIQTGLPVKADVAAFDNYKVRALPALRAATVVFNGGLANLSAAYVKIYSDIFTAGLRPTGETRETYLHWEGSDSSNNIILIQVGVEDLPQPK